MIHGGVSHKVALNFSCANTQAGYAEGYPLFVQRPQNC